VILYEKNADNTTNLITGATIKDVAYNGTTSKWEGVLNKTGIGLAMNTAVDYIMTFGTYDDTNTQSCQRRSAYWGDDDGLLDDGTTVKHGDRWV
jgi:hypothetical protein